MAAASAEAEAGATRRKVETRKGKQRSVVDAAACGEGNCRFMLRDSWHFNYNQMANQTVMVLLLGK